MKVYIRNGRNDKTHSHSKWRKRRNANKLKRNTTELETTAKRSPTQIQTQGIKTQDEQSGTQLTNQSSNSIFRILYKYKNKQWNLLFSNFSKITATSTSCITEFLGVHLCHLVVSNSSNQARRIPHHMNPANRSTIQYHITNTNYSKANSYNNSFNSQHRTTPIHHEPSNNEKQQEEKSNNTSNSQ